MIPIDAWIATAALLLSSPPLRLLSPGVCAFAKTAPAPYPRPRTRNARPQECVNDDAPLCGYSANRAPFALCDNAVIKQEDNRDLTSDWQPSWTCVVSPPSFAPASTPPHPAAAALTVSGASTAELRGQLFFRRAGLSMSWHW